METLQEVSNLAHVLSYTHLGVIQRYAKQENYSFERADGDFKECLKFLFLCANSEGVPCSPSNTIDKIWHYFILFTRDYNFFCEEYLGNFIHHNPTEGADALAYMNTRDRAENVFGILDLECWPIIDSSCCQDGCCQHSER
jgi:hypothetical protein